MAEPMRCNRGRFMGDYGIFEDYPNRDEHRKAMHSDISGCGCVPEEAIDASYRAIREWLDSFRRAITEADHARQSD